MICPACGTDNRPGARFCAKCGASLVSETVAWTPPPPMPGPDLSAVPPAPPPSSFPATPVTVERRYPVLRVVAVIYRVLGGIVAGITVLSALFACITAIAGGAMLGELESDFGLPIISGVVGGLLSGLITLLSGGVVAAALYTAGEGVSMFLSIEENTRLMATTLQQRGP